MRELSSTTLMCLATLGLLAALYGATPALAQDVAKPAAAPVDPDLKRLQAIDAAANAALDKGEYATATPLYRQIADYLRAKEGLDAKATRNTIGNMAMSLGRAGDHAGAVAAFAEVIPADRKMDGNKDPETLAAIVSYAAELDAVGRLDDAKALFAEVVKTRQDVLGPKDRRTLASFSEYGVALMRNGKARDAAPVLAEGMRQHRAALGNSDPATLISIANYAIVLDNVGQSKEAEPLYAEVLRGNRARLGEKHPDTLVSLGNYATVLEALGRASEAEPLLFETLRLRKEVQGDKHPDTITSMSNYGHVLESLGRSREAEPIYAEALRLAREVLGAEHPTTLSIMGNFASILESLGRVNEAEPLQTETLRIQRRVLGEKNENTIITLSNYGHLLNQLGRAREAEAIDAEALRLRREVLGDRHPDTLQSLNNYAYMLSQGGRLHDADLLYAEALRLRREVQGPTHPETLVTLNNYAGLLELQGNFAGAEPLYAEVLRVRRATLGNKHPDTMTSINNYANVLLNLGRFKDAEPYSAEALQLRRAVLGADNPQTIISAMNYAGALSRLDREAEAEALLTQSFTQIRQSRGDRHPDTRSIATNLAAERLNFGPRSTFAIEPARLLVTAIDAGATEYLHDADPANGGRDRTSAEAHVLLADAAWVSAERQQAAALPALRAEVFAALQNSLTNVTSRAMARSAALKAAQRSGVGAEAATRDQLIAARQALEAQVIKSYSEAGTTADEMRKGLQADLDVATAKLAALDAQLQTKAPDYFQLIKPRALTLVEARALLKPDEAALMLVPSAYGTQLMVVTHDGLTWARSTLTATAIDGAVRRLMWDVGGNVTISAVESATWSNEGEGAVPYDFATAYKLYHELIEPVEAALAGKKQVFVSSSGALSSLPLGILVTELPKGADGDPQVQRGAKWLADRYALSVIPSLQSLAFIRRYRAGGSGAAGKPYLGFGDPVLDGVAAQRGGGRGSGAKDQGSLRRVFGEGAASRGVDGALADATELRKLARLPATQIEIRNQWRAFGEPANAVFLAADATETRVKHTDLHSGVLSFATHGLLAGELKGEAEPGLVLTPPQTATTEDDGLLTASEISALKIEADWVILSACNTAGGDGSVGAPGLSGLSRAFFFAGATNLLVSHWPVRDDVASRLTVRAIEISRATKGLSRAEALQRAAKEIRDDASHDTTHDSWAHPSAWAPFSLVGDGAK